MVLKLSTGVGGWSDHGINPRDYSYNLALTCKENSEKSSDPLKILQDSYDVVNERGVIGTWYAFLIFLKLTFLLVALHVLFVLMELIFELSI